MAISLVNILILEILMLFDANELHNYYFKITRMQIQLF